MVFKNSLFFLLTIALFACGNSTKIVEQNIPEPSNLQGESIIWVNSYLKSATKSGETASYLLTQKGVELIDGSWKTTFTEIEGFTFEPGYICKLKVETIMVEGLPQLKLIEVISKERDSDLSKLHDIWSLTHLNGEVLAITARKPDMEINLTSMQVMGFGGCNQYSGKIEKHTGSTLVFGNLIATEMACEALILEMSFYKGLEETVSYEIKKLTLSLYNSDKKEVLRFQKVD